MPSKPGRRHLVALCMHPCGRGIVSTSMTTAFALGSAKAAHESCMRKQQLGYSCCALRRVRWDFGGCNKSTYTLGASITATAQPLLMEGMHALTCQVQLEAHGLSTPHTKHILNFEFLCEVRRSELQIWQWQSLILWSGAWRAKILQNVSLHAGSIEVESCHSLAHYYLLDALDVAQHVVAETQSDTISTMQHSLKAKCRHPA